LAGAVIPGEIIAADGDIGWLPDRARVTVSVLNTGDRPIQIGSHFHFADVNAALQFDRDAALGMRLDLPAGTSARFEPGVAREAGLIALGGERRVPGLQTKPA
jgi:urease beta subunit